MLLSASIVGYHNPTKHKGMKPEVFLFKYIRRQAQLAVKKQEDYRLTVIAQILLNWEDYVLEIKRCFPNTFT